MVTQQKQQLEKPPPDSKEGRELAIACFVIHGRHPHRRGVGVDLEIIGGNRHKGGGAKDMVSVVVGQHDRLDRLGLKVDNLCPSW